MKRILTMIFSFLLVLPLMAQTSIEKVVSEIESKGVDGTVIIKRNPTTKKFISKTRCYNFISKNGNYAEKLVATNFTVLHGLLQHTAVPEAPSVESGWGFLNEHGTVLADYYKDCVRQGLDYQQQLLAAMSHK